MTETWRVVLADGDVREVMIERRLGYWHALFFEAGRREAFGPARATPFDAIARAPAPSYLDVREILAPGELSRAEIMKRVREATAKAVDDTFRRIADAEDEGGGTFVYVVDDAGGTELMDLDDEQCSYACDGVRLCLDAIRALDLTAVVRGAP